MASPSDPRTVIENAMNELLLMAFALGVGLGLLGGMLAALYAAETGSHLPAIAAGVIGTGIGGAIVVYQRWIVAPRNRRRALLVEEGEPTESGGDAGD